MHLAAMHIDNFLAIRAASLHFDDTTVLIGENNSGRSSVLEALALVLQPPQGDADFDFQPFHFHRTSAKRSGGPLRIELVFRERQPGEWGKLQSIFPPRLFKKRGHGPRELILEVSARSGGSRRRLEVEWTVRSPGAPKLQNNRPVLDALRRHSPLLRVLAHPVPAMVPRNAARVDSNSVDAPNDDSPLAAKVRDLYQRLFDGTTLDRSRELQAGFEAARDLLSRAGARANPAISGRDAALAEILGRGRAPSPLLTPQSWKHGTAAHQIGLLLLAGAFLEAIGEDLAPGADPILVIEDPEAHLHPMTLAVVWDLIDNIRFQKIVGTHSGVLLSRAPLHEVRRLTRCRGIVTESRVSEGTLTRDELRKFTYHVRAHRGEATFARCWLLVEGETEFWLLPEFARVRGYDLPAEGIACVEYAQCGLEPLLRAAEGLGIRWHVLADGDEAGQGYARAARAFVSGDNAPKYLTLLQEHDIEHCMWRYGYADVYLRGAGLDPARSQKLPAKSVIAQAIDRSSKPFMALEVLGAVVEPNSPGVPPPLQQAIETCVRLARTAGG